MKKIITLLSVVFTTVSLLGFSQPHNGKINGSVTDGNTKIIESATITLLRVKDSSIAKISASDKVGNFRFDNIASGKYFVSISAVGHETAYSEVAEINEKISSVTLKTIRLVPQSKSLGTVTVTAKRPLIEQRPGMTVLNVDASPTNTGANALELLEKSPGVSVDNDGNISLKGKQGVLILIDGKPTYMSPTDLAAFLKNMQSSNLDQIEIMTNPPAKYDASGNSGIINIKTKKGNIKGMNGTANIGYSQSVYSRFNGSTNINYRNNKLNLFGGYNGGTYEGYNNMTIDRKFYNDDKTLAGSGDQFSYRHFKGNYQSVKAGMDYYFSKKDVAGFVVNGYFGDNKQPNNSTSSTVRDASENILYRLRSTAANPSSYNNVSANGNYKHTFDSTGREVSVDVDYAFYNNKTNNILNTQSFDENDIKDGNTISLLGSIPSKINIYSGKLDYVHPFKSGIKLETGLKTSYVETDNQVTYLRNNGSDWSQDDRSNHFVYKENINAAYAIFSKKMKKWDLTAGLRLENTISKGHQVKNDSTFNRNYTNLFPNIGLAYSANDKNQINFSYSRRVNRPDYEDLNPFIYFIDSLTYGQGNPYLQPQFTHNFELSHTYNKFLTTTINYTQTNGIMTQILKQDAQKKTTYQTTENLSSMKQFGIAVTVNMPVTKWWNINLYTNVFNNHYKGIYGTDPIDIQLTSLMGNMTNSFTMGKGWNAEVSGWFRSNGAEGLLIAEKMGALNSAISKQVLKKKGTIKMGVSDIFNTQQFHGYAKYSVVDVKVAGYRTSRQLNINFIYRFGKTNIPSERRKTGGANDEQNRVKSGGGN
ncbi:TonB-dependent receptor domain-containing protein [Segetibacter koreensis]|uniref:TonB-dependent receptor domain-containing protein n=1 Tax=Segetibacter koreensis TaxID=398037 RepID=UPI000370ED65|nr:TonB-dependent receptor [Segetibacter koreensis]